MKFVPMEAVYCVVYYSVQGDSTCEFMDETLKYD